MGSNSRRAAVLTLCAFALGGCGTAGLDLKTPTDGFATAATAAQTTLQTYDQVLDTAILQQNTAQALKGTGIPKPVDGDCVLGATRCRIVLVGKDSKPIALDSEPTDPLARAIMAGVVQYATNLQTIAAVNSDSDVQAAATSTLTNIGQIATDIDSLGAKLGQPSNLATKVSPYIAPVSNAAGFVLGAYLDSKKLAAMRAATASMNAILPDLLNICSASVQAGATLQRGPLSIAYQAAYSDYAGDRKSEVKLNAWRAAAAAWDASLSVDPTEPFAALVKAHAALTDALKQDKPDLASVMSAVQQAIAAAQRVKTILDEFHAAATPAAPAS